MNVINFTGNTGREASTKFLTDGTAVTSFSVALASGYGEKKITTWLNCTIFGKRGEAVCGYIKKGTLVGVSGEFTARPYQKDGVERLSLEVRVNDVTLLGGKPQADNQSDNEQASRVPIANKNDDFEESIPF